MEIFIACRLEFFFCGGVAFRPRQDLLQWAEDPVNASWVVIHFDKTGDRRYNLELDSHYRGREWMVLD